MAVATGFAHALRAALLVLLVVAGGCGCGSGVNEGDLNLVPLAQEWAMGEEIARQVGQEVPLLDDPAVQGYVERIGERLVAQTELADRAWAFHVVRDPALNAFAVPGGHVYVHTGLLEAAQSEAELAGVMAHEVAHGVARHATERLTTVYGMQMIARLVLGEEVGLMERIAAELIASGTVAKFSRDDEREADRLGVRLLAEAGYPPEAMARMFETMLEARARRPNLVERFFASHPLTEERIETVREEARALEGAPPPAGSRSSWWRPSARAARASPVSGATPRQGGGVVVGTGPSFTEIRVPL